MIVEFIIIIQGSIQPDGVIMVGRDGRI